MSKQAVPIGQDWDYQNAGRGGIGGGKRVSLPTSARELEQAKAAGLVKTQLRHTIGSNSNTSTAIMSAQKLDAVTDAAPIARVDKDLSKAIMQARTAKGLSQKDLATSINAKPQLIAEYENGKAIPDGRIIAMLERKLQTVLPRPGKTKPPPKDASAKTGGTTQAKTQQTTHGGLTRGGPPKRR